MLKVIVDVNVWISALLNPGKAENIVSAFKRGEFYVYYPQQLINDLQKVTRRHKLITRIRRQDVAELIHLLESRGELVQPGDVLAISRDPDDDIYLACAKAVRCDYLITGDADLLTLKKHGFTSIVTPAQFLKVLENG